MNRLNIATIVYMILTVILIIILALPVPTSSTLQFGSNTETATYTDKEIDVFTSNYPLLVKVIKLAKTQGATIFVVHHDNINAYTDGKNIYIYEGLLDEITERATAGVLLHEIGHIYGTHLKKYRKIIKEREDECRANTDPDMCDFLLSVDSDLLRISRAFEYEADMYAFSTLRNWEIMAGVCGEMFDILDNGKKLDFGSTHPATYKRKEQCIEYLNNGTEAYTPSYETRRGATVTL